MHPILGGCPDLSPISVHLKGWQIQPTTKEEVASSIGHQGSLQILHLGPRVAIQGINHVKRFQFGNPQWKVVPEFSETVMMAGTKVQNSAAWLLKDDLGTNSNVTAWLLILRKEYITEPPLNSMVDLKRNMVRNQSSDLSGKIALQQGTQENVARCCKSCACIKNIEELPVGRALANNPAFS